MVRLTFECPSESREVCIAELWEAGCLGIEEQEGGALVAFFDDGADTGEFERRFGAERKVEADTDWVEVARAAWEPLAVGERFFLVPEWRDDPAPAGRVRLEMRPGMACGTGAHPCTQLCLAAMERWLRPGDRVLDVGAGSGILTEAARLLGAGAALACDIDPVAVEAARRRLAGVLFQGSLRAVRGASVDLVLVNINLAAIEALGVEIERVLALEGRAILSGFPAGAVPELGRRLEVRQEQGWACVVAARC